MRPNPPKPVPVSEFYGLVWDVADALVESAQRKLCAFVDANPERPVRDYSVHAWNNFHPGEPLAFQTVDLGMPVNGFSVFDFVLFGDQPPRGVVAQANLDRKMVHLWYPRGIAKMLHYTGRRAKEVNRWNKVGTTINLAIDPDWTEDWQLFFAYEITHEFTHLIDDARRTRRPRARGDDRSKYYNDEFEFFAFSNQFLFAVIMHWHLTPSGYDKNRRIRMCLDVAPGFKEVLPHWTDVNKHRFFQWIYGHIGQEIAAGRLD